MEALGDGALQAAASAWPGPSRRRHLLRFLLHASKRLDLRPTVKYSALHFFAGRFLPALPRKTGFCGATGRSVRSWLLQPLRDSNLELFALVAVWIASKAHDVRPISVKSLKALGDRVIADQHFTCRDFANAELVFMEVLEYNIGSSTIAFVYLEELLIQFREISKLGDLLDLDVCMDILDILIAEGPMQQVRFATSHDEEEIMKIVVTILMHVLKPDETKEKKNMEFEV